MKRLKRTIIADELQSKLAAIVSVLTAEAKALEAEQDGAYQGALNLARTYSLTQEEFQRRLVQAETPKGSASEILTIYRYPDLVKRCCAEGTSVREVLRQARALRRGQRPTTTQEERLRCAAERVLNLIGRDKAWRHEGKLWDVVFEPASPNAKEPPKP